jgi:uncharacterized protein
MIVLASALLILCLGALWWFVRDDVAEYAAFKLFTETADRQRRYRVWVLKSFLLFSGLTVTALAILGRLGSLSTLPPELAALSQTLRSVVTTHDLSAGFLAGFLGAVVVGVAAGGAVAAMAAKRKPVTSKAVVVGDIEALMPRNGAETAHTALLSLNAGLSEELFFRLLLPLLLTMVLGNAVAAFVGAAIVFGLVHVYQGWIGVLATTILGLVLTALYLWTGSIWIAIGAHALLDLMGLVVRPTVGRLITLRH